MPSDPESDLDQSEAGPEDPGAALGGVAEYLVKHVVDAPDAVEVSVESQDGRVVLRVKVDPDDMGKVIGRGGRTARALRSVVRAAGLRHDVVAHLEITE